ncbi:glutamate ABC transporter substrate-binding protein [Kineosporia mesophila]|uniref:Glutamate ABC transporter substrate-binding protein n=1 Tax=Kineosporia mesophila TaxID=566012 RepID=A0ABP6Z7Z5_9ACTN|nr:transporter substrate-binding domain-containing protein [Kineosporia mesophila]MCD5354904.1 transporter substrate-binding domain-containing protein [Kineosporia mesophila]
MNTMRRRLPALLAALGLCGMAVTACQREPDGQKSIHAERVDVGLVTDSPGLSFSDHKSDPRGFDVDLAHGVVGHLGQDQKAVPFIINNVGQRDQELLDRDVALVVAAYSITKARNERGIDFAGPYLKTDQAFLVRPGEKFGGDQIGGRPVCVIDGSTADQATAAWALDGTDPRVRSRQTILSDCIALLKEGTVDAVFDDEIVLYGYLGELPEEFQVKLPGRYGQTQYYGIGILGGHQDDCRAVNDALREYLTGQWKTDFTNNFDEIPADRYASVNPFLPDEGDMGKLSCQVKDEPVP